MSETVTAYTVVRADGTSFDLPVRGQTLLTAGGEAVPLDGDDITMMRLEFVWPDDGGVEGDLAHPHGPWGTKWSVRRADVIEELSLGDVEALTA